MERKRTSEEAFDIASMRNRSNTSSRPRQAENPLFEVMPCKYMEGDNVGEFTGNMMLHFRASYENRVEAREQLSEFLLTETPRWNQAMRYFAVKIFTIKQAGDILKILRKIEDKKANHLPAVIDEELFIHAKTQHVKIISHDNMYMLDGDCYPLKELLKPLGFLYESFDGIQAWRAQREKVEMKAIKDIMNKYGWQYTIYEKTMDSATTSSSS